MSIVFGIIIFSVIVLFHEFGHFLLAKLNHVVVVEFSLGMGPRLFSFEKGGTRYSLKLLPFGGSCVMLGEDLGDMSEGTFGSKSVWARIAIVAAGPVFNFILAWILACIMVGSVGVDRPVILDVTEDYPAQQAGLEAGDTILSINGKRVWLYREVSDFVNNHQALMASGDPVRVAYSRDGEKAAVLIVPKKDESGRYKLGIVGSSYYRYPVGPGEVLLYGAAEVRYWIRAVFDGLRLMFTGQVGLNDVSGPVGIVEVIDETYEESKEDGAFYVWINMLNLAVLLSANLGVMNLLPIPALDGGRLLFFLVEVIRRKRLDPELEGRIHLVGLAVLLALMVLILANDVRRISVP